MKDLIYIVLLLLTPLVVAPSIPEAHATSSMCDELEAELTYWVEETKLLTHKEAADMVSRCWELEE